MFYGIYLWWLCLNVMPLGKICSIYSLCYHYLFFTFFTQFIQNIATDARPISSKTNLVGAIRPAEKREREIFEWLKTSRHNISNVIWVGKIWLSFSVFGELKPLYMKFDAVAKLVAIASKTVAFCQHISSYLAGLMRNFSFFHWMHPTSQPTKTFWPQDFQRYFHFVHCICTERANYIFCSLDGEWCGIVVEKKI